MASGNVSPSPRERWKWVSSPAPRSSGLPAQDGLSAEGAPAKALIWFPAFVRVYDGGDFDCS